MGPRALVSLASRRVVLYLLMDLNDSGSADNRTKRSIIIARGNACASAPAALPGISFALCA